MNDNYHDVTDTSCCSSSSSSSSDCDSEDDDDSSSEALSDSSCDSTCCNSKGTWFFHEMKTHLYGEFDRRPEWIRLGKICSGTSRSQPPKQKAAALSNFEFLKTSDSQLFESDGYSSNDETAKELDAKASARWKSGLSSNQPLNRALRQRRYCTSLTLCFATQTDQPNPTQADQARLFFESSAKFYLFFFQRFFPGRGFDNSTRDGGMPSVSNNSGWTFNVARSCFRKRNRRYTPAALRVLRRCPVMLEPKPALFQSKIDRLEIPSKPKPPANLERKSDLHGAQLASAQLEKIFTALRAPGRNLPLWSFERGTSFRPSTQNCGIQS